MKLYLNTALMIFFRVVCAVAFSSMAGYAFAMLNFRGKNLLFGIVLVQMSLPSQIFIIPQYQMVAHTGLANTIFALVFPGIVSAFGVFFLRQTYMGIPKEVGEAAYLDGCNQWQTFYKVMFPPYLEQPRRRYVRGCFHRACPGPTAPYAQFFSGSGVRICAIFFLATSCLPVENPVQSLQNNFV